MGLFPSIIRWNPVHQCTPRSPISGTNDVGTNGIFWQPKSCFHVHEAWILFACSLSSKLFEVQGQEVAKTHLARQSLTTKTCHFKLQKRTSSWNHGMSTKASPDTTLIYKSLQLFRSAELAWQLTPSAQWTCQAQGDAVSLSIGPPHLAAHPQKSRISIKAMQNEQELAEEHIAFLSSYPALQPLWMICCFWVWKEASTFTKTNFRGSSCFNYRASQRSRYSSAKIRSTFLSLRERRRATSKRKATMKQLTPTAKRGKCHQTSCWSTVKELHQSHAGAMLCLEMLGTYSQHIPTLGHLFEGARFWIQQNRTNLCTRVNVSPEMRCFFNSLECWYFFPIFATFSRAFHVSNVQESLHSCTTLANRLDFPYLKPFRPFRYAKRRHDLQREISQLYNVLNVPVPNGQETQSLSTQSNGKSQL